MSRKTDRNFWELDNPIYTSMCGDVRTRLKPGMVITPLLKNYSIGHPNQKGIAVKRARAVITGVYKNFVTVKPLEWDGREQSVTYTEILMDRETLKQGKPT